MRFGRFVVETHCHGQRHAARMSEAETADDDDGIGSMYERIGTAVPADEADEDDAVIVYDNSDRLLYDMEVYDVDMCVLLPAFGMTNGINQQIMAANPGTFVAGAKAVQTQKRARRGEEPWTIDAACAELDRWLSEDGFVLIGESAPYDPVGPRPAWPERRDQLRQAFEVAADHDVPISWHTGNSWGRHNDDPERAGELKEEFPDVPIVFDHGGMQNGWDDRLVTKCCNVAAQWDDVYLETGLYWADLFEKPYTDPNIGPEQLLWGGDWGASIGQVSRPGQDPPFYWDWQRDRGVPAHQPDFWGAAQRQLLEFAMEHQIEQDKLNLILGGNAARLFDLEVPETRLFERYV